MASVIVLTSP